jgi:hypothetical protein
MVISTRKLGLALVLLTLPTWMLLGNASAAGPSGSSYVTVNGACVPAARAACQGMTTWRDGEFPVPYAGRVRIVATWSAACLTCDEMRVYVGGIASSTGRSPLLVDLGTVGSGTYPVSVFFAKPVAGNVRQEVSWTVTYG